MPSYEYRCGQCEIDFDELHLSMRTAEKYKDEFPCPRCGSGAKRAFLTPSSFSFAGGVRGLSGVNGNSGVHDLDYPTLDKAVARSSAARWEFNETRRNQMIDAAQKSEVKAATQLADGSFAPATKDRMQDRQDSLKMFKDSKPVE